MFLCFFRGFLNKKILPSKNLFSVSKKELRTIIGEMIGNWLVKKVKNRQKNARIRVFVKKRFFWKWARILLTNKGKMRVKSLK